MPFGVGEAQKILLFLILRGVFTLKFMKKN